MNEGLRYFSISSRGGYMRLLRTSLALAVLGLAGLTTARADIVPTLTSVAPLGGGLFQYNYTANVSSAESMQTGDFLTLYDLSGLVSAAATPGFTLSIQNVGINPNNPAPIGPPDN